MHWRLAYKTPLGAFPLLCSWQSVEFAKFFYRQNQSVSNAFCMYAAHPPRYQHGIGVRARRKDTFFLKNSSVALLFFRNILGWLIGWFGTTPAYIWSSHIRWKLYGPGERNGMVIVHYSFLTSQCPFLLPFTRLSIPFSCKAMVMDFILRSDFPICAAIFFWVVDGFSCTMRARRFLPKCTICTLKIIHQTFLHVGLYFELRCLFLSWHSNLCAVPCFSTYDVSPAASFSRNVPGKR